MSTTTKNPIFTLIEGIGTSI